MVFKEKHLENMKEKESGGLFGGDGMYNSHFERETRLLILSWRRRSVHVMAGVVPVSIWSSLRFLPFCKGLVYLGGALLDGSHGSLQISEFRYNLGTVPSFFGTKQYVSPQLQEPCPRRLGFDLLVPLRSSLRF